MDMNILKFKIIAAMDSLSEISDKDLEEYIDGISNIKGVEEYKKNIFMDFLDLASRNIGNVYDEIAIYNYSLPLLKRAANIIKIEYTDHEFDTMCWYILMKRHKVFVDKLCIYDDSMRDKMIIISNEVDNYNGKNPVVFYCAYRICSKALSDSLSNFMENKELAYAMANIINRNTAYYDSLDFNIKE